MTSADRLAALDRTRAADGAVATAEAALRALVADYLHHPPGVILGRVLALQRLTDAIQAEYLLRPADTTRLWKVAGTAAGIRGWLENNAGNTDAARLSLREAHRRGDLIDDNQLTAWARYMQAVVEDYAGDPAAAEHYALDGLRHTSKRSPQRALLLGESIAGIRAARGNRDETERALAEAHDIVSLLPSEQNGNDSERMIVDAMTTCSPASFVVDAGRAYCLLGRPDRFREVTVDAHRAADQAELHWRVSFRLDEALAVVRSADPDPERAAALTREGLVLAEPFQAAHVTNRLGLIIEAAQPVETHPAIRDLIEFSVAWRSDRRAPTTTV